MSYTFDTLHAPELGGEPVLDAETFTALEELAGDDDPDLITELVELFLEDSKVRMDQIEAAIRVGDAETIGAAAHALKSSSANIGAGSLSRICAEVEKLAKTFEPFDPTSLEQTVSRTLAMYAEVCEILGMDAGDAPAGSSDSGSFGSPH